jgi:hypothetical protein
MAAENQYGVNFKRMPRYGAEFQNQGICISDFSLIAVQTKLVRLVCFLADLEKSKMAKILQITSFLCFGYKSI